MPPFLQALPPTERGTPLIIDTPDRQGLLKEILDYISQLQLNIVMAEILTDGEYAKDKITVNHAGRPLDVAMCERVTTNLRDQLIEGYKSYVAKSMEDKHPVAI